MLLAIIPARGGSRRIPRKNIRPFRGKPMIQWSIDAARESGLFDEVMVSTDDAEIASIAREAGAVVPFMRSAVTSSDAATTAAVLLEVLDQYRAAGVEADTACCIYATAPLIDVEDLRKGLTLLRAGDFESVFPVTTFGYPIWRSLSRTEDGRVALNFPEHLNARSQDLPTDYHDAGQWYWFRVDSLRRHETLIGPRAGSIIIPAERAQDIDTESDWNLALMKAAHNVPSDDHDDS